MKALCYWDYGIIVLYFVALIFIGQVLRRRATSSMDDYFLGGRKMPWWLLGVSGMAAWLDMTGTMLIASFLFMLGPRGLFIEFRGGAGLVLIFLLLWQGKWHRRSGCMTLAEWMIFRFGDNWGGRLARVMAVISTIIFILGLLAYSFLGAGLFLSMFLPFAPWVCALILLVVTIIYTVEAGFYGVVVADVFQMAIVAVATVYVSVTAFLKVGTVESFSKLAADVTGNMHWMSSLPDLHTAMPAGYEAYNGLLVISLFYLVKTMIQGMGTGAEPKYFGAKNDRECGLLSFLAGWLMSLRWLLMMGFVVLGLFLVHRLFQDQSTTAQSAELIRQHANGISAAGWPNLISELMNHPDRFGAELIQGLQAILGDDWARKLSLVSFEGTINPERILPAVLLIDIPYGLRGLILVALLAAAMSTLNAFINMATAYFTRDVYQGYMRPKASTRELMTINYIVGILLVSISFLMAFSAKNINDLWGWLMMGLSGGLIVPLALRLFWWRFNGAGFGIGTFAGLLAAVLQRMLIPGMPEWLQFTIILLIGLVGSVAGTYLTAPTPKEVLEKFYLKTRPFGLWRPLESSLSEPEHQKTRREHKQDLLALPFTFVWQVTCLLLPMQLIIRSYYDAVITTGLLLISLMGMYWFWYRNLPAANYYDD